MGFRVWGVGCGVQGVGCGVWGSGCGVWGVGFRLWGLGGGVQGSGFRVQGLGFGVSFFCLEFRVQGLVCSYKTRFLSVREREEPVWQPAEAYTSTLLM